MTYKIAFYSRVKLIERRMSRVYKEGTGENAKFREVDKGFYMLLEGSHEALFVGLEEPEFRVGDRIKVTMEKAEK